MPWPAAISRATPSTMAVAMVRVRSSLVPARGGVKVSAAATTSKTDPADPATAEVVGRPATATDATTV